MYKRTWQVASFRPIFKHGEWKIRCRHPRKREVRLSIPSAKNKNQAEALCDQVKTRYNLGLDDPWKRKERENSHGDITLEYLCKIYLEKNAHRWKDGKDGHTYRTRKMRLNLLKKHINRALPVSTITHQKINKAVNGFDVRQTTKQKRLIGYKALFNWANKEQITDINTKKFSLDRKPVKKLTGFIRPNELEKICKAYRSEFDGAELHCDIWRFTFYQGPRLAEIGGILNKHIDLDNKFVQIGSDELVTKHNMENVIPILPEALELVEKYYTSDPDKPLFPLKITYRVLSYRFTKAAKKAFPGKRDRWGMHLLRHSCGMYLRHNYGWHNEQVQEFLRHTTERTVRQYRHGAPSELRDRLYK